SNAIATRASICCAPIATARSRSSSVGASRRASRARGSTIGAIGACASTMAPCRSPSRILPVRAALLRRPAPVDRPGGAAHLVGGGRTEESGELAQLLRRDELPRRLLVEQQRALLFVDGTAARLRAGL